MQPGRAIHKVRLDKVRPAVILTREVAASFLRNVSVAPITSTAHGIATEVSVGVRHGLDEASVISCDNIMTVRADAVGELIGYLDDDAEAALHQAIVAAFDLD